MGGISRIRWPSGSTISADPPQALNAVVRLVGADADEHRRLALELVGEPLDLPAGGVGEPQGRDEVGVAPGGHAGRARTRRTRPGRRARASPDG